MVEGLGREEAGWELNTDTAAHLCCAWKTRPMAVRWWRRRLLFLVGFSVVQTAVGCCTIYIGGVV
jgi:hypothetical protein